MRSFKAVGTVNFRQLVRLKRPSSIPATRKNVALAVGAPLVLFIQRLVFTILGIFDIETSIIVDALKHPWQVPSEAPYGAIWYAINIPIGSLQIPGFSAEQSWITLTSIIDSAVLFLLFRYYKWWIGLTYVPASFLMWRQAPYNLCIMWLTVAGLAWLPSLVLAILAKLPIGAPTTVWNFISHSSQLQSNWRYYGLLAAVWFGIIYIRVREGKPFLPREVRTLIAKITGV